MSLAIEQYVEGLCIGSELRALQDIEESPADAPIYDLLGRQAEELKAGNIYIRNGKKFIAK